jgi:hypothetical protein
MANISGPSNSYLTNPAQPVGIGSIPTSVAPPQNPVLARLADLEAENERLRQLLSASFGEVGNRLARLENVMGFPA